MYGRRCELCMSLVCVLVMLMECGRHLAKDEMETITEDRWDEDIWGIEHEDPDSKSKSSKLIFYFGRDVSWQFSRRQRYISDMNRIAG